MQIKPGVQISHAETRLPFPAGCDSTAFRQFDPVAETPLEEGIRQTVDSFERLI
jgi:hypothetical protein